jgi:lipoprotein
MILRTNNILVLLCAATAIVACAPKTPKNEGKVEEDKVAKQMLQGIWINADDESVAFKVKGDTIFYPDSTSSPAYFQIFRDTLVIHGADDTVKYPIVKQAPHLFMFNNSNGETVKLTLSEDALDKFQFDNNKAQVLNQNQLIKKDTLVSYEDMRYRCYIQVNPTTYKVIKATYNDEGVEVDNVYHDNIVNLTVYSGANRLFSHDFRKNDFNKFVPQDFLMQAILSDLTLYGVDKSGVHFNALLAMPDSPSYYVVEVSVSPTGRLKMQLGK